MTAWRRIGAAALVGLLASPLPARADVTAQSPMGFVSRNVVVVAGNPAAVWRRLVTPSAWWSGEHTFSGDAANLTLDPVAGGCFCEKLPADAAPAIKGAKPGVVSRPPARGGVAHMRVVFVDHAKALRLVGGLGPLQSEAVNATLTVTLTPMDGGTRVIFEYVVGGYMRYPPDKIAPAVDTVLANQLISLAQAFGPAGPVPAAAPPPGDEALPAAMPGHALDKSGLLAPRGRVWSLPSSEPQPPAAPAEPLPNVAPFPTATVPQDIAASGGAETPQKKRSRRKPAQPVVPRPPDVPPPAPQDAPVTASAPPAAPNPQPKSLAIKPAKAVKQPAQASDEPSKNSINSAFDAAFGGGPPPPSP